MTTHRFRAVFGALLTLGVLALGMSSAAASPSLKAADGDPVLVYSGSLTGADGASYVVDVVVDCAAGPCLATTTVTEATESYSLTGGGAVEVVNGSVSVSVPTIGDACAENFVGGGIFSATATETTFSGTREFAGSGEVGCADGSSIEYSPITFSFSASLVSGDSCFLTDSCVQSTPEPTLTFTPVEPVSGSTGDFSAPSTFSTLATMLESARPGNVVWAAILSVVLVILVALPTHLLNSAVGAGTDRVSTWWRGRQTTTTGAPKVMPTSRTSFSGWALAAFGVLAASLISSFADPNFGWTVTSPRIFLSILVSFVLDAVLGWFLVIWLVRRGNRSAVPTFTFAPATLLIVVAAVAFSRLTGFQPGIVFGLVAGVSFGAVLAAQRVRVTLIGLGYGFAAAIIGWAGYSLLAASGDDSFAAVFAQETLSAMAIGGIAALPIALIPLRGLAGHEVFTWNRLVWAIAYCVGLFGFFFVLMPMPFAWTGVPLSLGVWIALYLGYAIVAVGSWLLIVRPWRATSRSSDN